MTSRPNIVSLEEFPAPSWKVIHSKEVLERARIAKEEEERAEQIRQEKLRRAAEIVRLEDEARRKKAEIEEAIISNAVPLDYDALSRSFDEKAAAKAKADANEPIVRFFFKEWDGSDRLVTVRKELRLSQLTAEQRQMSISKYLNGRFFASPVESVRTYRATKNTKPGHIVHLNNYITCLFTDTFAPKVWLSDEEFKKLRASKRGKEQKSRSQVHPAPEVAHVSMEASTSKESNTKPPQRDVRWFLINTVEAEISFEEVKEFTAFQKNHWETKLGSDRSRYISKAKFEHDKTIEKEIATRKKEIDESLAFSTRMIMLSK